MHPILKERTSLALYLVGWGLIGGLLAFVIAGSDASRWAAAAPLTLPLAVLYAFICLGAWYICLANPVPPTAIYRVVGTHFLASFLSTGLWLFLGRAWARLLGQVPAFADASTLFDEQRPLFFSAGVLLYLLTATLSYLLLASDASRKARQKALELEVLAREAELQAFRTQIDPHFLFNCLNSISSLCGSDPEAARHTTVRLGEFLRSSLRLGAHDAIPLREELELCAAYLDVERVRFGDRLTYSERVEEGCGEARVPALLLQPLFENALKHGIAHLLDGGEISLECRRSGDELVLTVRNTSDPDRPRETGSGIGLANVEGRLALLYGSSAALETSEDESSFTVVIRLPGVGIASKKKVAHV